MKYPKPMKLSIIFGPLLLNYVVSFAVQLIFCIVIVMSVTSDYMYQSEEFTQLIQEVEESGEWITTDRIDALMTDEVLDELTTEMITVLENNIVAITIWSALASVPVFAWLMRRDKKKRMLAGMQETKFLPIPLYGFIVLGSITLCIVLNNLTTLSQLAEVSQAYVESSESLYSISFPMQILAWGIISPLSEEVLFRGVLYKRLRNHLRPIAAMLWSALIFGVYHGNLVQFVYAFISGMMLAWVYEKFGSLKAPILAHMCMNITALVLTQYDLFYWMFEDPMRMAMVTALSAGATATAYVLLRNIIQERAEQEMQ